MVSLTLAMQRIIAENVTKVLRMTIEDSQSILLLTGSTSTSFDKFPETRAKLLKRISDYDKENERLASLLNISVRISPYRRKLSDDVYAHASKVTFTKENIDELMKLVTHSLIVFGLDSSQTTSNTALFLRRVLKRMSDGLNQELGNNAPNDEIYQKTQKWLSFVSISENGCVHRAIDCKFAQNYYDKAFQIQINQKTMFAMDDEGKVIKSNYQDYYNHTEKIIAALTRGDDSALGLVAWQPER